MNVASEALHRQHKAAANGLAAFDARFVALVRREARIAHGLGRVVLIGKDARSGRNDIETMRTFEAIALKESQKKSQTPCHVRTHL